MDYDQLAAQAGAVQAPVSKDSLDRLAKEAGGDSMLPGWVTDALKHGPGFIKETGQKMGAAALRAVDSTQKSAAENDSTVPGLLMKLQRAVTIGNPLEKAAAAIDVPAAPGSELFDKTVRAAGGGLILPVGGAARTAGAAGIGAVTGDLAGKAGEKVSPAVGPYAELLGNLFGGGLAGWGLGPKQSLAHQDIRTAGRNADFPAAQRNADIARANGSTTATAAEMFPPNSGMMTLAAANRGGNLDNALRTRTENREGDIQGLANRFLENFGSEVDPNSIANAATGAANGALAETKRLRGDALGNTLARQVVTPRQVTGIYSDLYSVAENQSRPGAAQAYKRVAEALVDQNNAPMTNVQQLSLSIKALKTAARNPNNPIFNGGAIDQVDLNHAIQAAESALAQASPAFRRGMADFRNFSRDAVEPQRQGPIGSLSDRNPLNSGQTPVSKLENLVGGNSEPVVAGVGRVLGSNAMTGGNAVNPRDIAQALARQRLVSGGTDPGAAVRGAEGSAKDMRLRALIGPDAAEVVSPLQTADRLQAFTGPAGENSLPKMGFGQMLIRPFRTMDMAMTANSSRRTSDEIARLLADPANLPELQRIAMFDPAVRRMLSLAGAGIPALTHPNSEK